MKARQNQAGGLGYLRKVDMGIIGKNMELGFTLDILSVFAEFFECDSSWF